MIDDAGTFTGDDKCCAFATSGLDGKLWCLRHALDEIARMRRSALEPAWYRALIDHSETTPPPAKPS